MIGADRWQEVDRLFAAALDLPPAQRPAWLDAACAGRPGLRQAIERLLAADAREDSFLDRPPGAILTSALAGEPEEGERLGPYRLLRPLGHGGMGTVYLAVRDDAREDRQVAVKILHAGLESTALRHRFLAERQILARLDHPGIARLYTVGGTEDGRPYLVMERIEGEPVDAYCDRHRLTVDQRLALFRKICAAVEHAHRHLLVHRDLKPANILVTPEGEPKLLDFGIAKQLAPAAAESGPRTRTGLRVMTPSYASPEQVRGEAVTTASDVYSLGVLLCELLCGRGPYPVAAGAPLYEIERAICEREPEPPSEALSRAGAPPPEKLAASRGSRPAALRRRLAGDLDTIVLKALRKEPAERYESVSRLSSDLELYLQNLPVSARPDTWGYRARKLLRRHRGAAAAAAVVLLLAAGLVASLLLQSRRLARERDKARHTLSFLVDTFKEADPRHLRGERLTAREVLEQGAGRVSRELAGQPDVQAAVMDAIGEVSLGLGRNDQAAPMLERALALRRRALGPESLDVAESLRHLAELRVEQSDFAGAEKLLRQALAIERRRLGDAAEVAGTLNQLGQTLTRKGDFRGAEPLHRQALAIARRAEGPRGPTVAEALLFLAQCRDQGGDYPAAETLYQQGLALEKQLLGERNPAFAKFQAAYGSVLMNQGNFKPAEAVFRRSLAIQRQALGEDHPAVAQLLNDLAESRHGQGDLQGAEALYRQALSGLRNSYGEISAPVGDTLANLGSILEIEGRSAEAIPLHEEALSIRRRIHGDRHQLVAHSLLCLARTRLSLGQLDAALPLARRSLSILQTTLGPEHPLTGRPSEVVGLILQGQGKAAEAEPYLRRAVELLSRSVPPGHPKLAETRVEIATCLISLGRLPEAASLLCQAEPVLAAQMGPDAEPVRKIRAGLADIERQRKTLKSPNAAPAPPAGPRSK